MGAMGRSLDINSSASQTIARMADTFLLTEGGLDGLVFYCRTSSKRRLQFFIRRMRERIPSVNSQQDQCPDANGSGRMVPRGHAFEYARLGGTSSIASEAPSGANGQRRQNSAHPALLDFRDRFNLPAGVSERPDLLAQRATFRFGGRDDDFDNPRERLLGSLLHVEPAPRYDLVLPDNLRRFNSGRFDRRHGWGFTDVTFLRPYAILPRLEPISRPNVPESLHGRRSPGWHELAVLRDRGSPASGPLLWPDSGPEADRTIDRVFHVLVDDVRGPIGLFSDLRLFPFGCLDAPRQDSSLKYEVGAASRFRRRWIT